MWSLFIPASTSARDSLSTELWELGTSGLVEEAAGLRSFFEDDIDQESICTQLGLPLSATKHEAPFDPSQLAALDCDPILIGQKFFVAPSSVTLPTPPGRVRLTIDTTIAFGSGRHESTQLCMEALEEYLKPGDFVADIGCGSGILSAAASALGAGTVVSCDIHQGSVEAARRFIQSPIFVGSADCLRSATADIVLANLSLKIVDIVAHDLQRITKPNGLIVMSGFLHETPPKKFTSWKVSTKGDWGCWLCRRDDIHSDEASGEPVAHSQQWWL